MKKWLAILLILALATGISSACASQTNPYAPPSNYDVRKTGVEYGTVKYHTYQSQTTGTERKCYVILPPGYDSEKTYPVLYLFHGIGGDHGEWMGGKPDVILGNMLASGEAAEMIVVMPNCKAFPKGTVFSGNMYSPDAIGAFNNFINEFQNDLVPFIASVYPVASGRENTAVAGLSMGGRVALHLGLTLQEEIGYIGAFCPAPGVLAYEADGGLIPSEEMKVNDGLETLILINTGLTDNTVGAWPKTYSEALAATGTDHIYYETIGGHDFFVWKNGLYNFAKRIFKP